MDKTIRPRWLLAIAVMAATFLAAAGPTVFGEGVTVAETVTVADLLVRPDTYVDRRVQVEGVISAVSTEDGRWIDLSDASGSRTLRFRSTGDGIVFPPEVKGHRAVVEGQFLKIVLSEEEAIARAKREGRRAGGTDDASRAVPPRTVFVIEGTGAVVH